MGCKSSMDRVRSTNGDEFQIQATKRRSQTHIPEQADENFPEEMQDYSLKSKIYKKSSVKKAKSGPRHVDILVPADSLVRRSHSANKNGDKVHAAGGLPIQKEINFSLHSTVQSAENSQYYDYRRNSLNKHDALTNTKKQQIPSLNNYYIQSPYGFDLRFKKQPTFYQSEDHLPTVLQVSQQQLESGISNVSVPSSIKNYRSYDYLPNHNQFSISQQRVR